MKNFILETCVDSVESAIEAYKGGATRLELCSNLVIGGTTPEISLYQLVKEAVDIPVHILIRPRFGDFCYTDYEYTIMENSICTFRNLGAQGVVIGILKADGTLNLDQMRGLMKCAEGMSVTLHRAFDMCVKPKATLEEAVQLGIDTILTSGQQNNCVDGAALLAELTAQGKGRIVIQIGSGVNAEVIRKLYPLTHATAFHMSGKVSLDSEMVYRKENVNMGLKSMSEYEIWRTDAHRIREARNALEEL